jgi:hypothetical protein
MNVVHILKDGSLKKDISGHVVRVEYAGPLYQFIDTINRKGSGKKIVHSEKSQEVKVC